MNLGVQIPTCSKCQALLGAESFNLGQFSKCPACDAQLWVEVFPALFRPVAKGSAGEPSVVSGESVCFYHENKKAAVVCDVCGRFLCGLCDCELGGRHFCPSCLETGKKKRSIAELDNVRMLYGRQALLAAFLPLVITGPIAIFMALKYWRAPDSLVSPKRWAMPVALAAGILQTLAFTWLFYWLFTK